MRDDWGLITPIELIGWPSVIVLGEMGPKGIVESSNGESLDLLATSATSPDSERAI